MDELRYDFRGNVYNMLKASKLEWFATAEFGADLLLKKDVQKSARYIVYVRAEDTNQWSQYLKSQGACLQKDDPLLMILMPTNSFETLRNGNPNVVGIDLLVEDLSHASPRYLENIRSELENYALKNKPK